MNSHTLRKSNQEKNEIQIDKDDIFAKILHYETMFQRLYRETTLMKKRVIFYYSFLNKINLFTQMSIICLSAFSTFLQSAIPEDNQNEFMKYGILGITSYSGLALALMKFNKLEEKKENAHNLRDRFADMQAKICHIVDYISPWGHKEHFAFEHNGDKVKNKDTEWAGLIEKVENDYMAIIDLKRDLFSNYDKLFDNVKTIEHIEKKMKRSLWKKLMNRNYEDEVDELNIITSNERDTTKENQEEDNQEEDNQEEDNQEGNLEEGNP